MSNSYLGRERWENSSEKLGGKRQGLVEFTNHVDRCCVWFASIEC